jgi:hypothetical protein
VAIGKHELLWQLHEDTEDEVSELQQREIDARLDEQSGPSVAYAKDLATAVHFLERELIARGHSLKTH